MQENVLNKASYINITSSLFNSIYDICKAMKMDYFLVEINITIGEISNIYGTDSTFSTLSSYRPKNNVQNIYQYISFITSKSAISDLSLLLCTPTEYLRIYDNYIINDSKNDILNINNNVIDFRGVNKFKEIITKINHVVNTWNCSDYGIINEDQSIIKLGECKVADNIIPYIKDKYYMVIYKGIVPNAKADKLSLKIYDPYDNSKLFLSEFIVRKKKNMELSFYYLYLNTI